MQVAAGLLFVVALVGVIFVFTSLEIFPVVGFAVLITLFAALTARVVQLQWHVATLDKSNRTRRREIEDQIAALGMALRHDLQGGNRKHRASESLRRQPQSRKYAQPMVGSSPGAPLVGRVAAGVPETGYRHAKLNEMLNQLDPNPSKTRILGILSASFKSRLVADFEVEELSPGILHEQIYHSVARIIIIDEEAFRQGPWYGADSAAGTLLCAQLSEAIEMARNADIAIWYVATGATPNPYTNEIRDAATGVFGFNAKDASWNENFGVLLPEIIEEYANQLGRKNG